VRSARGGGGKAMASAFGFETGGTDFVVGGEEESESESDDASPYEALSISILPRRKRKVAANHSHAIFRLNFAHRPFGEMPQGVLANLHV